MILLIGVCTTVYGFFQIELAKDTTHWPTVQGNVYYSKLKVSDSNNDGKKEYKADIRYTYHVNHRGYESATVYLGSSFELNSPETPRRLVAKYPVNSKPKVYYRPEDPRVALLEPGTNNSLFSTFGVGVLMMLVGIIGTVITFREQTPSI